MSRITREEVIAKVSLLRTRVTATIVADYSIVGGGWRLSTVTPETGKRAAKGFPGERVDSRCFFHLLNVAIAANEGVMCG